MRKLVRHLAIASCLMLALPGLALAQTPQSTLIANGVVTVGVRGDAGLIGLGLGDVFLPTTLGASGAGWSIGAHGAPTSSVPTAIEAFTSTPTGAYSVVRTSEPSLLVTHSFQPAPLAPNLYEVMVTVQNVDTSTVAPLYQRPVSLTGEVVTTAPSATTGWSLVPSDDGQGSAFNVILAPLAPGTSETFRLYVGAAETQVAALDALTTVGAQPVTATDGQVAFVVGYAPAAGNSGSGGGNSSGGGGSGGGGGGGGGDNGASPNSAGATSPTQNSAPPTTSNSQASNSSSQSNGSGSQSNGSGSQSNGSGSQSNGSGSQASNAGSQPGPSADTPGGVAELPLIGGGGSGSIIDPTTPGFVDVAETPELGTLALFGSGLAGMGGYALTRWRARRRPPTD